MRKLWTLGTWTLVAGLTAWVDAAAGLTRKVEDTPAQQSAPDSRPSPASLVQFSQQLGQYVNYRAGKIAAGEPALQGLLDRGRPASVSIGSGRGRAAPGPLASFGTRPGRRPSPCASTTGAARAK